MIKEFSIILKINFSLINIYLTSPLRISNFRLSKNLNNFHRLEFIIINQNIKNLQI